LSLFNILWEHGGLCKGISLELALKMLLDYNGRGLGDATMQQMYEATGVDFSAVAADVTRREILILNHRTAPDVPVSSAVRMSMTLPMMWEPVRWRESWGPYMGVKIADNQIVDGGILNNFPLQFILSKDTPFYEQIMGNVDINPNSLGFLLDEEQSFGWQITAPKTESSSYLNWLFNSPLAKNISGVYNCMAWAHDTATIKANKVRIVRLPVQGIDTTEFEVPLEKTKLVWGKAEEVTNVRLKEFMAPKAELQSTRKKVIEKVEKVVHGVAVKLEL